MRAGGPTRVVMIGGGYATLHAYRSLTRRAAASRVLITVISADDHHNFHGFTGEVVAGLLPHELTRTPLVDVLSRAEFVHGRVVRVDLSLRMVIVQPVDGSAERRIRYDELVVGSGGREPLDAVPGMAEHGFTLRAPGEFGRFLSRLSEIEAPAGRAAGSAGAAAGSAGGAAVVIAGGGMAGVELAAAVRDRLRSMRSDRPVVLVQSGPETLPGLRAQQPRLATRADRELSRLGVEVRTGVRIDRVDGNRVALSDGTFVAAAAVLATTGQRAVALPGLESLPHDRSGRLVTDGMLQVAPSVWAAGDAAQVAHPRTREPVAANALWAIKAGGHVGRNISRVISSRSPLAFGYRGLGQAMAFGIGRSASELYGIPILGIAGWIMRLGFFLRFLPQRRRAVSVVMSLAALPFRGRYSTPMGTQEVRRELTAA